jgi:hypothetical protein
MSRFLKSATEALHYRFARRKGQSVERRVGHLLLVHLGRLVRGPRDDRFAICERVGCDDTSALHTVPLLDD